MRFRSMGKERDEVAGSDPAPTGAAQGVIGLAELERLTKETFDLWDEVRVGFSWRSYYMNHTLRVRANALAIGALEGADPAVLAYAATLHDITKRYDGPFKVDQNGRRVVNKDGLWVNEPLMPKRANRVTELYDEMNLYYQVHHESGAAIAQRLLTDGGHSPQFAQQVAHVIRGHLRPINPPWRLGSAEDPYGDPESCVLYDADTIDANLGAVAFYRHVQIHGYREIREKGAFDPVRYVDAVGEWVARKQEFVSSRISETAKAVAADRYETDRTIHKWLEEERRSEASIRIAREYDLMGLVQFFLQHADDPDMNAELDAVERFWLPERRRKVAADEAPAGAAEALHRVERLVAAFRAEMEGRIGERLQ